MIPDGAESRWIDAIFEFAWQPRTGVKPLTRNVYSSDGYSSLVLNGDGTYPRTSLMQFGTELVNHDWATEGGYPFKWASEIDDITSQSIRLLEWISAESWKGERSVSGPLKVFVSYCHADEAVVNRLKKILTPLQRKEEIDLWYDRELIPGSNLDNAIAEQCRTSDVFLFVLSEDFLASDYCTSVELRLALERAGDGHAAVVGIVARPCVWTQEFPSELLALPTDARPITAWRPQDSAWVTITEGLQQLFTELKSQPKPWDNMRPSRQRCIGD
ncbi:MAG: toll/interleukin-1 receptor domain-containing protein [Planctomycetaceae bacterium]|nr:toll/interleukin-1 receptor domain-containing protein [Planctomycetaceae bacterium]